MQSSLRPAVLLLESDSDTRDMYGEYFAMSGFDVIATGQAKDALSRVPDADVVVTGTRIPGLDGIEIVRRLRRDERTKDIGVVVLTACALEGDRNRAEEAGCDAFLLKPCLPPDLLAEVRRVLGLRTQSDRTAPTM